MDLHTYTHLGTVNQQSVYTQTEWKVVILRILDPTTRYMSDGEAYMSETSGVASQFGMAGPSLAAAEGSAGAKRGIQGDLGACPLGKMFNSIDSQRSILASSELAISELELCLAIFASSYQLGIRELYGHSLQNNQSFPTQSTPSRRNHLNTSGQKFA